jgi:aldehyde:ferredoxin oxidoreductase
MYGYSGKILHIDLKTKKNWVETKPEEWYKIYIGGVSMASRLLWENITPGCDPLDDGNPICFANGNFHRHSGACRRQIWAGIQIAPDRLHRR